MASEEDIKALARIVLRHKQLIEVTLGITADLSMVLEPTLERCCQTGCKDPATVTQIDLQTRMCDYHAAAAMIRARENLKQAPEDELTLLRVRLADEECWTDLPNAPAIRRLHVYVQELRKYDEPAPPLDKAECH